MKSFVASSEVVVGRCKGVGMVLWELKTADEECIIGGRTTCTACIVPSIPSRISDPYLSLHATLVTS